MNKKLYFCVVAAVVAALLFAGCTDMDRIRNYLIEDYVAYSDMEYSRPDMEVIEASLEEAIVASRENDPEKLMEKVYDYYDDYDAFYTNYALADIRYSGDLTDLNWADEYRFCLENSAAVDAGLEELYYALAQSPCREALESEAYFGPGYFDAYEGENAWDATFTAMLEQESQLQSRYYELTEEGLDYEFGTQAYYDACGAEMVQLLLELIGLRQEMADYWEYDSYAQFAHDLYYYRDYTAQQAEAYLQEISGELVPLYKQIYHCKGWDYRDLPITEEETYDYVRRAATAMGGVPAEAFALMDKAGLYDISYGENKYHSSFEVYLTTYWEPFVFMNPGGTAYDQLVFVHEFGHFCNDYASYGSYAGTDVTEVFSQSMEYLSLCYADAPEELVWLKMADSLSVYVEQAALAAFEQQMYELTGEQLCEENLRDLYSQVIQDYGMDTVEYQDWEFVDIPHYYTNPMYVISYVVSNDVAMQLYQLELEEAGAGLARFEENLDTGAQYLLEFVSDAGLKSPFEEGRLAALRKTLEEALK